MNTNDRELLELAAKAAGIEHGADRLDCGLSITLPSGRHYSLPRWNPLVDDGDALRLAVKVGMEFAADDEATHCAFAYARVRGAGDSHIFEPVVDDPCKAMRRAIVRAAAEIGRQHD